MIKQLTVGLCTIILVGTCLTATAAKMTVRAHTASFAQVCANKNCTGYCNAHFAELEPTLREVCDNDPIITDKNGCKHLSYVKSLACKDACGGCKKG
ncbi:MAG: hypothetical protein COB66_07050 [Coxiella sp. (in: Bacteria)]|nr:MAG: hypothetical protein COB66_07050 [Coxiella sp. (in: g-proteobacteria)]